MSTDIIVSNWAIVNSFQLHNNPHFV
jgi:hypothetical protein